MVLETHGPLLVGVSWFLVIVSGVFLSLRVYCKYMRSRGLWWDDGILIFAWVCLCVDACCISIAASLGFGRHLTDINPKILPYLGLIGNFFGLLSILAAMFSKMSFALTLLRICESRMRILLWFILVSVFLSVGGSALIAWIQCTPLARNWDFMVKGTCWNPQVYVIYGIITGVYGGCMDMLLALLPWKMIWKLQMKKKEKIGVAVAMSIGVFAGVIAMIKSAYIPLMTSPDFSFVGTKLVLWGQAESGVCIVAASIPQLRVLLRNKSGKYFKSSNHGGETGGWEIYNGTRSRTTTAITSGGRTLKSQVRGITSKPKDGGSDRDVLNNGSLTSVTQEGIMQSTEIAVEYHYENDLDENQEFGFELRKTGDS